MQSQATLQFMIIAGLDIVIVVLLVYYMVRNERARKQPLTPDLKRITELQQSFQTTMSASQEASQQLLTSFDEKITQMHSALTALEKKEKQVSRLIGQAQSAENALKNARRHGEQDAADPYRRAADLINQGCDNQAVQQQCRLSLAEIDLIRHIVKSAAAS